jgi:F-type H+-transporting ATPase subunit b
MNLNLTLLGQMITFIILVWFTMRYVWPPLMKIMEERRKKIADGLAAAERGQHDLELAQYKAKEIIREAKAQASVIIEQANHRAHKIAEDAEVEARHIAERIKKMSEAEIAQQYTEARKQLRSQVAGMAVAGAEKLLQKNIDQAANQALLQALVEEI